MKQKIEKFWYQPSYWQWIFWPIHLLVYSLVSLRRRLYLWKIKKTLKPNNKIIVVGNVSIGGTGKTPFIIWLVEYLQNKGKSVAVISRGYGGQSEVYPLVVTQETQASQTGDEPKLLAERLSCPVVVDPNRVRAAFYASETFNPDVIVSDDGLQHYALGRDFEICIVDGLRQLGNRFLLPVGPLREPVSRLSTCDLVVQNSGTKKFDYWFDIKPTHLVNLSTGKRVVLSQEAIPFSECRAICGIGNPEKFEATLTQLNLQFKLHTFEDHHHYQQKDFELFGNEPIIMTEKDAVKCRSFAKESWWYIAIDVIPNDETVNRVNQFLSGEIL
jgi:tetraacyldisaccharide 4'-kinase